MRARTLTATALLLVALTGPALADAGAPNPADLAFLQSLAGTEAPAAGTDAPAPAIGTPAPKSLTCTATVDCGDGNTVTCTGNSICQVTNPGVKCDGVETRCPNYCVIGMSCQCCDGTRTQSCFSRSGNCQRTDEGIACNGIQRRCICPLCPQWP
jgi:hypothetical protein